MNSLKFAAIYLLALAMFALSPASNASTQLPITKILDVGLVQK